MASPPQHFSFEVENDFAALDGCIAKVRAFLTALQIDPDAVAEVSILLDELASNVIRHAWPQGGSHSFVLALAARLVDDGIVELGITLDDDGVAFDPTAAQAANRDLPLLERPPGGFGLRLIAAISDSFAHRRIAGRNQLTVIKRVRTSPRSPPSATATTTPSW